VRYLLDTHVFLWANATPEKLNAETRELFDSSDAVLYFSAISAYEIALKVNLGKLRSRRPPRCTSPSVSQTSP